MKYQNLPLGCALLGLSLATAIGVGCGDNIQDVDSHVGAPVQRLQVDVPDDVVVNEDDVPRAALLWTALSQELGDCIVASTDSNERYECYVDHYRPQVSSVDIPLDANVLTGFAIPIHDLPAPEVLSGSDEGRIGWGKIVLYDDGNENQALDLLPAGTESSIDSILGVSEVPDEFGYLQHAEYVVFREGELSSLWSLFEGFGCGDPEVGYSVVSFGWEEQTYEYYDFEGNTFQGVDEVPYCTLTSADEPIGLSAPWENAETMLCLEEPLDTPGYPDALPEDADYQCYSEGIVIIRESPTALCPSFRRLDLVGCDDVDDEAVCDATYWDLTSTEDRPTWWPCQDERRFSLTPLAGVYSTYPVTNGNDTLLLVGQEDGFPTDLERIEIVVETPTGTKTIPTSSLQINEDYDMDGALSSGESLQVVETDTFSLLDTASVPGTYQAKLYVDGTLRSERTWTPMESVVEVATMEVSLEDAPGLLTDELLDPMVTVTCESSSEPLPLSELRVSVHWSGEIPLHIDPLGVTFSDNDNDGLFGAGDTLDIIEMFYDHADFPNFGNGYEDFFPSSEFAYTHAVTIEQKIGFEWYDEIARGYVEIQ